MTLRIALPSLAAGDVLLTPLCASDAPALFRVLADPALYRYLDEAPPPSEAFLRERFARLEARASPDGRDAWLNWTVACGGGPAAGYLQATVRGDGTAWIAYVLGHDHWGRGIASRALGAVLQHLREAHYVTEVFGKVEADNEPSVRLLLRAGFRSASPDDHVRHGCTETERLYVLDCKADAG